MCATSVFKILSENRHSRLKCYQSWPSFHFYHAFSFWQPDHYVLFRCNVGRPINNTCIEHMTLFYDIYAENRRFVLIFCEILPHQMQRVCRVANHLVLGSSVGRTTTISHEKALRGVCICKTNGMDGPSRKPVLKWPK